MTQVDASTAQTLSEQAQSLIREGIIKGTYPPGVRLRERDLSQSLGVSRVPVRQALTNLAHEGFVTFAPRRGAIVREMSLRAVDELFDMRLALEPLAARRAATLHAAGRGHVGLQAAMAAADDSTDRGDAAAVMVANADFHVQLIDAADHGLLADAMQPLLARTRWLFAQTSERDAREQCTEHRQMFDAIRNGQAELAALLAATHVESGRAPSLHSLRATGRAGTDEEPKDLNNAGS